MFSCQETLLSVIISQMYELMVITNPKLEAEAIFSRVEKTLKDANAVEIKSTKMGRKQLAYPIKKFTEGEYFVFNFEAEGEAIFGIDNTLRLEQEAILRHLIITVKAHRPSKKVRVQTAPTDKKVEVTAKVTVKTKSQRVKESKSQRDKETKVKVS